MLPQVKMALMLILSGLISISVVGTVSISSQNYLTTIQITNNSPFSAIVNSADVSAYDGYNNLVAVAWLVEENINIKSRTDTFIHARIQLMVSEAELSMITTPITVITTIHYTFIYLPFTHTDIREVTIEELQGSLVNILS